MVQISESQMICTIYQQTVEILTDICNDKVDISDAYYTNKWIRMIDILYGHLGLLLSVPVESVK